MCCHFKWFLSFSCDNPCKKLKKKNNSSCNLKFNRLVDAIKIYSLKSSTKKNLNLMWFRLIRRRKIIFFINTARRRYWLSLNDRKWIRKNALLILKRNAFFYLSLHWQFLLCCSCCFNQCTSRVCNRFSCF